MANCTPHMSKNQKRSKSAKLRCCLGRLVAKLAGLFFLCLDCKRVYWVSLPLAAPAKLRDSTCSQGRWLRFPKVKPLGHRHPKGASRFVEPRGRPTLLAFALAWRGHPHPHPRRILTPHLHGCWDPRILTGEEADNFDDEWRMGIWSETYGNRVNVKPMKTNDCLPLKTRTSKTTFYQRSRAPTSKN